MTEVSLVAEQYLTLTTLLARTEALLSQVARMESVLWFLLVGAGVAWVYGTLRRLLDRA